MAILIIKLMGQGQVISLKKKYTRWKNPDDVIFIDFLKKFGSWINNPVSI